jgi:hypothetical protein
MSNAKLQQGSVLTKEDAFELGLINSKDCNNRAIIISHDCDLANNAEYIEFIIGTLIHTPDPLRQHAHHPRQLHLTFDLTEPFHIELDYYSKKIIEKNKVTVKVAKTHVISEHGKQVLKQWLAAGYGRPAFPNEFEKRLRKVRKKIEKTLNPESKYIYGLFFDLGKDRTVELDSEEAYFLSIYVIYDASQVGSAAREVGERVAAKLQEFFEKTYGMADSTREIALEKCIAIADTHITLADIRKIDQWRLEYTSLKNDPPGSFLFAGSK